MNNQYSIKFPSESIKLKRIYQSNDYNSADNMIADNPKIREVYGEFSFPELPQDRTYTLGSFVQSLDGKIAFPESPDGTLVARSNRRDSDGALADYWILNMLRSVSDAVLMGDRTIEKEPELTGHVYDHELEVTRLKSGKSKVPLHVIVSGDGTGMPLDHRIVKDPEIPLLIVTTKEGKKLLKDKLGSHFIDFNESGDSSLKENTKAIVSMGSKSRIDLPQLLVFLKKIGIGTILIESPTFLVSLMKKALLDELYLNTSSVFIGGKALSLGSWMDSFSIADHPHGKVVSIHTHSDYFFYTRYRMEYGV